MSRRNRLFPIIVGSVLFIVGAAFANSSLAETQASPSGNSSGQSKIIFSPSPSQPSVIELSETERSGFPQFKSWAPSPTSESTTSENNLFANIFALKMKGIVGEQTWTRLLAHGADPESITYDNVRYCIFQRDNEGRTEHEFCVNVADGSASDGWFDYGHGFDGPQDVIDNLQSMQGAPVDPILVFSDGSANCVNKDHTFYCFESADGSKYTKSWSQAEDGTVSYSDPVPFN